MLDYKQFRRQILVLALTIFGAMNYVCAQGKMVEGGIATGGANLGRMDESQISLLLSEDTHLLKTSMINYLKTMSVAKVENPEARKVFLSYPGVNLLLEDILKSRYYISENAECRDAYNNEVGASARIGEKGGVICFDIQKIAYSTRSLSAEKAMIKLAALAFHEHVHHFQNISGNDTKKIEANEYEAYALSAYVELTAKTAQVPILKWDMEDKVLPLCSDKKIDLREVPVGFRCHTSGNNLQGRGYLDRELKYSASAFRRYQSADGDWGWLDENQKIIFYDPYNYSKMTRCEKPGQSLPTIRQFEEAEKHGIKEVIKEFTVWNAWRAKEAGWYYIGYFAGTTIIPWAEDLGRAEIRQYLSDRVINKATICVGIEN